MTSHLFQMLAPFFDLLLPLQLPQSLGTILPLLFPYSKATSKLALQIVTASKVPPPIPHHPTVKVRNLGG